MDFLLGHLLTRCDSRAERAVDQIPTAPGRSSAIRRGPLWLLALAVFAATLVPAKSGFA